MPWQPTPQETDGCWLWQGGKTTAGYGTVYVDGKTVYVHRVSHEAYIGPIPDGYQIDHLCRVRNCYNPAHLEAVTPGENVRRTPANIEQRSRTHCHKGHPYDGVNRRPGKTVRRCLTCHRERERARLQRNRDQINARRREQRRQARKAA